MELEEKVPTEEVVVPNFRLAQDRLPFTSPVLNDRIPDLFTPGEVVSYERGLIRGHGTYLDNDEIKSSLAGLRKTVNKLLIVRSLRCRYGGEIGDVVVGRITEIQQKRWKVDVNAKLHGVLLLSSVNLPGGELRRRSVEDERMMRQYLSEGDLISAEVQNTYADGSLSLHTRNLKYGKLSQGVFTSVPPALIKKTKTHFHVICGASLIIGTNGYIWIYPVPTSAEEGAGGFARNLDLKVQIQDREAIARINACIEILVKSQQLIFDTSIIAAVTSSSDYQVFELQNPEIQLEIAMATQARMEDPDENY